MEDLVSKNIVLLEGQKGKIIYKPTFRNIPIPDGVIIDKDGSIFKDMIDVGECGPGADGITGELPFVAKAKAASEIKIVFVRKDSKNNIEGKDISTQQVSIEINPSQLTLITAISNKVRYNKNNIYNVEIGIKNGDQEVSLKNPFLSNKSSDIFTIVNKDDKSLTIKMDESNVNKDPTIFNTPFILELALYSSSVRHTLDVYWEPEVKIEKSIPSMSFGDKGALPIKVINGKGENITSSVTNVTSISDYFKFNSDGSWEVIKEISENITHEITLSFDILQEEFSWPITTKVSFNLIAKPKSINATLLDSSTVSPLSSGTIRFKLAYDTGEVVTDAVYVKHSNTSSSKSFSSFGGGFKIINGNNGEYSVNYTSGYVEGLSRGTLTITTKYGNYTLTLPSVKVYNNGMTITPNTTLFNEGSKNEKYTLTATQLQDINGSPVTLYGSLELVWLSGATVVSSPSGNGPWSLTLADNGSGNTVEINFRLDGVVGSLTLYKA